jgi:hypothetical protein
MLRVGVALASRLPVQPRRLRHVLRQAPALLVADAKVELRARDTLAGRLTPSPSEYRKPRLNWRMASPCVAACAIRRACFPIVSQSSCVRPLRTRSSRGNSELDLDLDLKLKRDGCLTNVFMCTV